MKYVYVIRNHYTLGDFFFDNDYIAYPTFESAQSHLEKSGYTHSYDDTYVDENDHEAEIIMLELEVAE